jgi:hypothetical protein
VFRGNKKAVAREVADCEAQLRGTTPSPVGATVSDLLKLWQTAKANDWQPTTVRDQRLPSNAMMADLGPVRLVDLDPFVIDEWIARM